jgi:hypothetical protein
MQDDATGVIENDPWPTMEMEQCPLRLVTASKSAVCCTPSLDGSRTNNRSSGDGRHQHPNPGNPRINKNNLRAHMTPWRPNGAYSAQRHGTSAQRQDIRFNAFLTTENTPRKQA